MKRKKLYDDILSVLLVSGFVLLCTGLIMFLAWWDKVRFVYNAN